MPMAGMTICDKCLGYGSVKGRDGHKNDCTVCDGTGLVPATLRDAQREFDRKEDGYVEKSGATRGELKRKI